MFRCIKKLSRGKKIRRCKNKTNNPNQICWNHTAPSLLGPVTVFIYKFPTIKKAWMIFGEFHGYKIKCDRKPQKTIINFFKDINQFYSKKNIDYFIEAPFLSPLKKHDEKKRTKKQEKDRVDIRSVVAEWNSCLIPQKQDCNFPNNIRAHYVDIRRHPILLAREEIMNLREEIGEYIKKIKKLNEEAKTKRIDYDPTQDEEWISIVKKLRDLFFLLYKFSLEYYDEKWWKHVHLDRPKSEDDWGKQDANNVVSLLYYGLKMDKQIDNIDDKKIQKALQTYWNEQIKEPIKFIYTFVHDLVKVPSIPLANMLYFLNKFYKGVLQFVDGIMEIYTMARMFRRFPNDIKGRYYFDIAYLGFTHAIAIEEFLRTYLNIEAIYIGLEKDNLSVKDKQKGCLNTDTEALNLDNFFDEG